MRTAAASIDPLGALAYATTGAASASAPFSSIEVRMVPENVTNAPRSRVADGQPASERLVVVRHGETIEDILRANGASKEAVGAIVAAFGARRGASPVAEGQRIIFQYDEPAAPGHATIGRISVYSDEQLKATVAVNDAGAYVPVTMPAARARKSADDRRGSLRRHAPLRELLRDGAEARHAAPDHRPDGQDIRQRRRFPARHHGRRFGRGVLQRAR